LRNRSEANGDLINAGERVAGELVEYAPPIVDTFPVTPYSAAEIIALNRQRNLARTPPAPRLGSFRHRSLRRTLNACHQVDR
jgi:hypothetical protein